MNPTSHIIPILLGFVFLHNFPTTTAAAQSITDFEELTKIPYFVDKTYMLKIFFSLYDLDRYLVVTAPRKFGKSVNLNMIKRFAQMEFDKSTGLRVAKNQTSSYRLFTDKSLNLTISQYPDVIEKHLAEYPVVYFNMKFNVYPNTTTDDIMRQLRVSVQNTYKEYEWLYQKLIAEPDAQDKERKAKLEFMKKALDNTLDPVELAWCLRELNYLLFKYFNKRVVLLIEDYDWVMNEVIFNPGPNITGYYRHVSHIFYYALRFYETLDALSYSIVSGISEIPFRANCMNFAEIQLFGFLRPHDLATCHGFTEDEVHELLDRHKIPVNQRDPIRDHYNGFFVDRTLNRIYNPYDVISYLSDKNRVDNKFPKYWIKTRPAKFLLRILKAPLFRANFVELLIEGQVYFKRPGLVFGNEVAELMESAETEWEKINEHEFKVVFYFLYEHGYLCHTPQQKIYKVSNPEVHQEMSYFVRKWFMINTNVTEEHYNSIGNGFYEILKTEEKVSQKTLDDLSSILKEAFHGVHYNNCVFINKLDLKDYDYRAILYSAAIWHKKVRVTGDIRVITTDLDNPLPHLVVYNKRNDVIVTHIHYDIPAEKALQKAKAYYLHGWQKIRSKKFLGINVRADFHVDIALEDPKFTTVASSTSDKKTIST